MKVLAHTTPAFMAATILKMRLPFSVQTPADRPYGVLFAFSIASSGVRKVSTDRTGPKISSCAIRWLWLTPVKRVGRKKKPLSGSTQSGWKISAPSSIPDCDELLDLGQLAGRVDGADVGVLVERIPDPQRREAGLQLVEERLVDRFLHEQADPAQHTSPWLK